MRAETVTEIRKADGWAEDFFLVALFALVGGVGMAVGTASDSPVQLSIGFILVVFAARVLADIVQQRVVSRHSL